MAHLKLVQFEKFEYSSKNSSVDFPFSAEVAFLIILSNLLLILFQCTF